MQLSFSALVNSLSRAAANTLAPGGVFGEMLVSELSPQYHGLVKANRVFSLAVANITALTAFTGGAAGTPLFGIYNPANSGVDIALLRASLGVRSTGTTAAQAGFNYWIGNQGSTPPTGTQTLAKNNYSGATGGSASYCMVNVANTGAVAASVLQPSFSLGNVTTTAGVNVTNLVDDVKGAIVIAPGNYLAFGSYAALAAAAIDAGLIWAELPV